MALASDAPRRQRALELGVHDVHSAVVGPVAGRILGEALAENLRVHDFVGSKNAPGGNCPSRVAALSLVGADQIVARVLVKSIRRWHHDAFETVIAEADDLTVVDGADPIDHDRT